MRSFTDRRLIVIHRGGSRGEKREGRKERRRE